MSFQPLSAWTEYPNLSESFERDAQNAEILVELRPTEEIRADLERLKREIPEGNRFLARRLTLAQARDVLVEERRSSLGPEYDACWCLGRGGRHAYVIGIETAPGVLTASVWLADGSLAGPINAYREYCPCPDGQGLFEQHASEKEYLQEMYRQYVYRRRAEVARIPRQYDGLTLGSWADAVRRLGVSEDQITGLSGAFSVVSAWAESSLSAWDGPRVLLLAGTYGGGKTGLAAAVAQYFLAYDRDVVFRSVAEFLAELRAAPWRSHERGETEAPITELELIRQAQGAALLVLDDFGDEALTWRGTDRCIEALLLVLNQRLNENLPTILTTNLNARDLGERVGERLLDRILPARVGVVVALKTPSLRKADW